jgi:hypothetical protein
MKGHALIRWSLLSAVLLLGSCAASRETERAESLRVRGLEATTEELRTRLAWEADERQKVTRELEENRMKLEGLEEELRKAHLRNQELGARWKAGAEREAAAQADLDLCAKSRSSCEEDRARARRELALSKADQEEEQNRRAAEVEVLRGRVATLEAQALLLAAEQRREAREKTERVEELRHTYEELLAQARERASACEGGGTPKGGEDAPEELARRAAEAEDLLRQTKAKLDGLEGPLRERCGEAQSLFAELSRELAAHLRSGDVSLALQGSSLAVFLPRKGFGGQSADLAPGQRELLARVAAGLRAAKREGGRVVVLGTPPPPSPAAKGKSAVPSWELGAARAAKVARDLADRGTIVGVSLTSGVGLVAAGEDGAARDAAVVIWSLGGPSESCPEE